MVRDNLEKNLDYFKIILGKLPVAISVSDTNGEIIYVNDEFKELYKIKNEEIIGFKREEFYIKEDREKIRKAVEKCKLDGKSFCEAISITKLPVMINYKLIKVGNKEYISGTATNISEIKEREEELNFIFENSRAAMVLTDEKARWIKVNRAFERDSGYTRNELIGKTLRYQPFVTDKTIKALDKFKSSTIEKRVESHIFIDVPERDDVHKALDLGFKVNQGLLNALTKTENAISKTETQLPEELDVVSSLPAVFMIMVTGDFWTTYPGGVTIKSSIDDKSGELGKSASTTKSLLEAEYERDLKNGVIDKTKSKTDYFWEKVAISPDKYLEYGKSITTKFTEYFASGTGFAVSREHPAIIEAANREGETS